MTKFDFLALTGTIVDDDFFRNSVSAMEEVLDSGIKPWQARVGVGGGPRSGRLGGRRSAA